MHERRKGIDNRGRRRTVRRYPVQMFILHRRQCWGSQYLENLRETVWVRRRSGRLGGDCPLTGLAINKTRTSSRKSRLKSKKRALSRTELRDLRPAAAAHVNKTRTNHLSSPTATATDALDDPWLASPCLSVFVLWPAAFDLCLYSS